MTRALRTAPTRAARVMAGPVKLVGRRGTAVVLAECKTVVPMERRAGETTRVV